MERFGLDSYEEKRDITEKAKFVILFVNQIMIFIKRSGKKRQKRNLKNFVGNFQTPELYWIKKNKEETKVNRIEYRD